MTTEAFLAELRLRWRFVAVQAVAALFVVVLVVAVRNTTSATYTAHFVLHPAKTTATGDVANLASELRSDGPVVQTVLKVLSSRELLSRAATQARVPMGGYTLSASISPGSTYFDAGIDGPHLAVAAQLGRSFESVASSYVETSYHGYTLESLGHDTAKHTSFPPSMDVLILALALGAVLAVGELFVSFAARHVHAGIAPHGPEHVADVVDEESPVDNASTNGEEHPKTKWNGSVPEPVPAGVPAKPSTRRAPRKARTT